ncbi:hypothetical protein Nmel_013132 [Mimus melanotis]
MAQELFLQVLEAVWHCISCENLHRDIKPENILFVLASGQAKLIYFGSPRNEPAVAGTKGKAATIWSLGILLHQMVCGEHLSGGAGTSAGAISSHSHNGFLKVDPHLCGTGEIPVLGDGKCQDLIRWCLSMHDLGRSSLEDLFCDSWMQDIHLP